MLTIFCRIIRLLSLQFRSVAQLCLTLCNPVDCSNQGLPVHHQLPELTQTHVHWFSDAIQPSHPVVPFSCLQSFPASGSFPMSQWIQFQFNSNELNYTSFENCTSLSVGLPRWIGGKESTCKCRRCKRRRFDPWVRKIPWSKKWQSTLVKVKV